MAIAHLRLTAVAVATAAWAVVVHGLWFLDPTSDPTRDLEAGGGFAATIDVYLPAAGLSVLFAITMLLGARGRRMDVAAAVVGVVTVCFCGSVLRRDYLLDYAPGLSVDLWAGSGLAALALLLAAVTWLPQPADERAEKLEVR